MGLESPACWNGWAAGCIAGARWCWPYGRCWSSPGPCSAGRSSTAPRTSAPAPVPSRRRSSSGSTHSRPSARRWWRCSPAPTRSRPRRATRRASCSSRCASSRVSSTCATRGRPVPTSWWPRTAAVPSWRSSSTRRLSDDEALALADQIADSLRETPFPDVAVGGDLLAERTFTDQAVQDAARGEGVALVRAGASAGPGARQPGGGGAAGGRRPRLRRRLPAGSRGRGRPRVGQRLRGQRRHRARPGPVRRLLPARAGPVPRGAGSRRSAAPTWPRCSGGRSTPPGARSSSPG